MRYLVVAAALLVAAPAHAQIVRVSVSTAGAEANGPSRSPAISGTGRFVVFSSEASNLVTGDTNNLEDVFVRDRDTDADGILDEPGAVATTRLSVAAGGVQANGASKSPTITADGRYVAFSSNATNLVAGVTNTLGQVYRLDRQTNTILLISQSAAGVVGNDTSSFPVISADGDVVAFHSRAFNLTADPQPGGQLIARIFAVQVSTGQITRLPTITQFVGGGVWDLSPPSMSDDGSRVAYLELARPPLGTFQTVHGVLVERASNAVTEVPVDDFTFIQLLLSPSGTVAYLGGEGPIRRDLATGNETKPSAAPLSRGVFAASQSGRFAVAAEGFVDFELGLITPPGFGLNQLPNPADFSADGRWLAVSSPDAVPSTGTDTNTTDDIFVIDLPLWLDADADGMDDRWETIFGVTDPGGDPDGDGQTNAQEEDAGTHPNGRVRRFLAEGATGSFFHTTIALANPSPTLAASAVLTFDSGAGARVRRSVAVPAGRSAVVDIGGVAGLWAADVSTTVESDRLLGVERSMTWGTAGAPIYGSSAETATPAPSATWFLAEGSTVLGFDLFYLLQNAQSTTTRATVRFLLPSGTSVVKTYDLAPGSRTTIYVNLVEGLDETDVSGDISADAPIIVERSMYRSRPGEPFSLGTESMGVTAPATSWFLAEGATGTFFDLYVLIANPGNTDATVRADYAKPDGSLITQTYTVRAHSRHSVYVDSIPGLTDTSVATTLTSTNGVPIVAERAMYWPGGFFDYYEGHSSAGSTTTALEWVVAGGRNDLDTQAQTYVLIANTENRAGEATLTLLPDVNTAASGTTVVPLPPNSRTTVPFANSGATFGVRVQSTGASAVQLVVESAVYLTTGGVGPGAAVWNAGSDALATPVVP